MLISIHYQMQYSFNKHSKNVLLVKKTMIIDNHLINKNEEDQNKTKKKKDHFKRQDLKKIN